VLAIELQGNVEALDRIGIVPKKSAESDAVINKQNELN
jgi:hypothetical protein